MIISGEKILLKPAGPRDKRLIYDMLVNEELKHNMFSDRHPAPTWEEFNREAEDYLFNGALSKGNYLLIWHNGEVIGTISFCCVDERCQIIELDIWMGTERYTGKGLGVETINCLTDYLHKHNYVNTFIIRPWCKNLWAIRAYKKAGFREIEDFLAEEFYSYEFLDWYADGDYGVDETVNMIKEYQE